MPDMQKRRKAERKLQRQRERERERERATAEQAAKDVEHRERQTKWGRRFAKWRHQTWVLLQAILLLAAIAIVIVTISQGVSWVISQTKTNTPLDLSHPENVAFLAFELAAFMSAIYMAFFYKKQYRTYWTTLFADLAVVLFPVGAYVLLSYQQTATIAHVKQIIQSTKVSYGLLALAGLGFFALIAWQYRQTIRHNLMLLVVPTVITVILEDIAYLRYRSFNALTHTKGFSAKELIYQIPALGDLNTLNNVRDLAVIGFNTAITFMIGGLVYAFVWQKTRRWHEAK